VIITACAFGYRDPNPAKLRHPPDELRAAGKTVDHLPRVAGEKSADLLVDGIKTEVKTLEQMGPNTMKNAIETAAKQGENIIIDARNTDYTLDQAANQVARAQGNIGGLEGRITILTKDGVYKF
jgi:hypothetical protein